MDELAGSQQRIASCGKVPYRLAGGFRPVKQFPFPCLPDTIDQPTRRYNHKGFERSLADLVAHRGNEKKRVVISISCLRGPVTPAPCGPQGNISVPDASEFNRENEK